MPNLILPRYVSDGYDDFDCAINGIPFNFANVSDYPQLRRSVDLLKNQIDSSGTIGENSYANKIFRAQSDFSYGAGDKYLNVSQDKNLAKRYHDSAGVDLITNEGQVTLLHRMDQRFSSNQSSMYAARQLVLPVSIGGVNGTLWTHNQTLHWVTEETAQTVNWGGNSVIFDITTDGESYYIIAEDGIYRGTLPTGSGFRMYSYNSNITKGSIAYKKDHLIAAPDNKIYDIILRKSSQGTAGLPASGVNGPLYTHNIDSWRWTDISEGPSAIYLSGFAGSISYVYMITLTTVGALAGTDDNTPALAPPVFAMEAPRNEIIWCLESYVGTFLMIGSSAGIRFSTMNSDGSLTTFGTTIDTDFSCRAIFAIGNDVYCGGAEVDGHVGIYKINLKETTDGQSGTNFAYQKDKYISGSNAEETLANTNIITSIGTIGASGRLVFAGIGHGLYFESALNVSSGWFAPGIITMDTQDEKIFQVMRVTNEPQPNAHISVLYTDEGGVEQPLFDYDANIYKQYNDTGSDLESHLYLQYRFVLSTSNPLNTPVFKSYRVEVQPANIKQRIIQVALQNFYHEVNAQNNLETVRKTKPRILALEAAEEAGRWILYQNFRDGEESVVTIDNLQWLSNFVTDDPYEQSEPGGYLVVQLLTQDLATDRLANLGA